MTTTSNDNDSDGSSVQFVVTGFGPFQDSKENPTTILANQVVDHLQTMDSSLAARTTTCIIETSVQAARAEVDKLVSHFPKHGKNTIVVHVHLGVNYRGTQFQLEQCAYNDASFRIPDEQGYQPQQVCISQDCPFGTCLNTTLNVQELCQQLQWTCSDTPFVVSTDPGRFVCNYTYYYSLTKTQDYHHAYSLFVHVPPFLVIPQEKQMAVLVAILQCIDKQIQ